jgi:hypothetical protein
MKYTSAQARNEARLIAQLIYAGEIDAYDGAMKIWKEILDKLDERIPDDLWIFKSNASAIEDMLWVMREDNSEYDYAPQIARYVSEIKLAAGTLLAEIAI